MITKFKQHVFSLKDFCNIGITLFIYSFFVRTSLIEMLELEMLFNLNIKKLINAIFGGISVFSFIGVSLTAFISLNFKKYDSEIILNNDCLQIETSNLKSNYSFSIFAINTKNPFLLSSKTLGLRE